MTGNWDSEDLTFVRDNLVDVAANAERFRAILLIAISEDGTAAVLRRLSETGSNFEVLGILGLLKDVVRSEMHQNWYQQETPPFRDNDDEDK